MGYICTDENRYLGEHTCETPHYGDDSVRRQGCIADCLDRLAMAERVAMTTAHPAVRLLRASYNHLTVRETDEVDKLLNVKGARWMV